MAASRLKHVMLTPDWRIRTLYIHVSRGVSSLTVLTQSITLPLFPVGVGRSLCVEVPVEKSISITF